MCHHEINIGKRSFGIGGVTKLYLRRLLFEDDFTRLGNHLLTRAIVVIKFQRTKRETVLICQQHQHDARRKGTTTTCDNH